jgi:hypothetical protein
MSVPSLGRWDPLSVTATIDTFRDAPFRWWLSGGHALELHLGRSWRYHDDTDVGINRRDIGALPSVLAEWDLHVAAAGRLEPWKGGQLQAALHQNNLWCRRHHDGPWQLDVTIGEGDDELWVYRRDPSLQVPWAQAVLQTPDGVPYLAPVLQLLFKSKDRRDKDDTDARQVIPELDRERRDQLARLLPTDHPWHDLIVGPP